MDVNIDTAVIESTSDDTSNARSWKAFADAINGTWRKGAANYIDCGKLLCEANDELRRDFNMMVKTKLDFEASVARKLMCIAANEILCAHVHKLPACWSTLYELSQLSVGALKAAFADGSIHPRMMRKDAIALKPSKPTKTPAKSAAKPATDSTELSAAWQTASPEQRQAFLDALGRDGLCTVMSSTLRADLRDHVINLSLAGASNSTEFAAYASDKLHTALYCATREKPDEESLKKMVAVLGLIAKRATAKGIAHSNIVISEGKPRKGRK
jgi:hypothetical protein